MVADADMVQYHGAEAAQRFILTVMNMVSLPLLSGMRAVSLTFPQAGGWRHSTVPLGRACPPTYLQG